MISDAGAAKRVAVDATLAFANSLECKWWQSNLAAHAIVSVVNNTGLAAEINLCIHGEIQR